MKLAARVAYNTIIQFISKFIATILGLVTIAIITRYLGQIGFGQYTTAITFISFFGIIADLGLTLVTVQLISQPRADQDKILGNLFTLRLVSALLFLGLGPIVVLFFPYTNEVKSAVFIASIAFLFIALNQVLVGLFQKHLRLDKVSIAEVIGRIVLVGAVACAVIFDWGLIGIMIATMASNAVSFLLHFIFSRSFARIRLRFDFSLWRSIIARSWPLTITIVLNLIYLKTDTLLLSILPRNTDIGIIAEVGIYGAAYRVIDVAIIFPFMFAGIILPILTKSWAKNNKRDFQKVLQKSFDAMVILSVPMVVGTQFLARDVMALVAGPEFAVSGPVLQILIIAAGFIFLGIMFSHAIIAINKQRKIIAAYLFTAVTTLIGYLVVIPIWSYRGAAWVTIYSELTIATAAIYLVWKYTRFCPNIIIFIKSLLAALAMAVSYLGLQVINLHNLWLALIVATIVYFSTLYILKGVTKQDLDLLLNKEKL